MEMIVYCKERKRLNNSSPHYSIPIQERHKKEALVCTSSNSFKDIPYIIKETAITIPTMNFATCFIATFSLFSYYVKTMICQYFSHIHQFFKKTLDKITISSHILIDENYSFLYIINGKQNCMRGNIRYLQ